MDEVRVWHFVRSAKQIAATYNKVLDGKLSGVSLYWQFGGTGYDSSGNGNHLQGFVAETCPPGKHSLVMIIVPSSARARVCATPDVNL